MARIRTIKPDAFTSEKLASVSRDARWLFAGLLTHVDDEGRCIDNPLLVKAAVMPLDEDVSAVRVGVWLDDLADAELVIRYEVDGRRVLCLPGFLDHQRINRATPSTLPPPPGGGLIEDSVSPHGAVMEDSGTATGAVHEGSPPEGKGTEVEVERKGNVRGARHVANEPPPARNASMSRVPPESSDPAERLTRRAFDRDRKPMAEKHVVTAVLRRALDSGRTYAELEQAIDAEAIETWTIGALGVVLDRMKAKPAAGASTLDQLAAIANGAA